MSARFDQLLPHRLARSPSLWADALGAWVVACLPCGLLAAVLWKEPDMIASSLRGEESAWLLGGLGLLCFIFLARAAVFSAWALEGQAPIVEVDAQPWRPGAEARIRMIEPAPGRYDGVEVLLRAYGHTVQQTSEGTQTTYDVIHEQSLLSASRAERPRGPVEHAAQAVFPLAAAGEKWDWKVVVRRMKGAAVREDRYPVEVDAGTPEAEQDPARRD